MRPKLQLDYRDGDTVVAYNPDTNGITTVGYRRAGIYLCAGCDQMWTDLPSLDEHVQDCPKIRR